MICKFAAFILRLLYQIVSINLNTILSHMRTVFALMVCFALFLSCKKDKFETVPHIEYKSIKPNVTGNLIDSRVILTFKLTDAEGDFGPVTDKDTAFIYVFNRLKSTLDSVEFPDLGAAAGKNFSSDVEVELSTGSRNFLSNNCNPGTPSTDTLFFDIYVKDFGKNKSNVITTTDPLYFICE